MAIDAIEAVTKHDVIAFLTWAGEKLGPERRWLHQGMTSSDVLDTALAVQLKQAADLLIADLDALLAVLKRRAFEHKLTPTIGRSHGIHAEPTTFGLKLAQAYAEFARNRERLIAARDDVATCAISGAVGTFANVPPGGRGACRRRARPDARAGLDPGDPARPPRDVLRHARRDRLVDRAAGDRDPPSPAHRSARGGGIFLARPEGQLGDAAQAQPGADREPHRPRAHGPRLCHAGAGECRVVARARHLALVGRAVHRARRDDHARLRARAAHERRRQAPRLSRADAEEPRPHGRPGPLAARAAGANPGGPQPRRGLCPGAAQRDESVGIGRAIVAARPAQGRPEVSQRLSADELDALFDLDYHFKHVDTIFDRLFGPPA